MSNSWTIGVIKFVDIGPGFFGIVTDKGEELLPLNLPEQLKYEGRKVEVLTTDSADSMSMFMWGKAVRIIGFKTI